MGYAIGSHLKVARTGYTHHGIYIGDGKVIHYAGFCETFKSGPIEITTLDKFQGKAKEIKVVSYACPRFSGEEIVRRAKKRLGEDGYHLFSNNCEHFAHWCVTDESVSSQIQLLKKVAVSAITLLVAGRTRGFLKQVV